MIEQSTNDFEKLRRAAMATAASVRLLQRRAEDELVSAKRALEERTLQLAASVAMLKATLESSPDGIIAQDLSRRLISCNARFGAIWNLPQNLLVRGDCAAIDEFIAGVVRPAELFRRRASEQSACPQQAVCDEFELADGRSFERHAVPQLIDGYCTGVVVTWREITARKQAELARLSLELRMREGQKLESLGTLASGIAHDFNNILGALIGNAVLAREDLPPNSPAMVCMNEIERAGNRGRQLIQRILNYSRKQPQDMKAQPLGPIIEEAIAILRATLPSSARLEASIDASPLYVYGDATQIAQVVMNLCTNAWQALAARPGRVEIALDSPMVQDFVDSVGAVVAPGRYARLRVSDDGQGMEAATQARIFEPFFTTKPIGHGTGLGLALVHSIVGSHGGAIRLRSVLAEGTTFEILLPLVDAPAAEPAAATLPAAAPAQHSHIIYIDDDEPMVFLVERLLQRRGYRVSAYEDAAIALAALRAKPQDFDLLVTDFNMPLLSGLDVAREATAIRPGLPVVLISGVVTEELQVQAAALGVCHLLQKAHAVEEMCETISRLLDERSA